jgi:hypothetical protein
LVKLLIFGLDLEGRHRSPKYETVSCLTDHPEAPRGTCVLTRWSLIDTFKCEFGGISHKNISMEDSAKLASTPELHHTPQLSKPRRFPAIGAAISIARRQPYSALFRRFDAVEATGFATATSVSTTRHRQEQRLLRSFGNSFCARAFSPLPSWAPARLPARGCALRLPSDR